MPGVSVDCRDGPGVRPSRMLGRPVVVAVVLVLCAQPSLQDCSTKETKAVQTEFQECSQGPFINYVIRSVRVKLL